ncbi:type II secretion system GspH family protein [Patescibacteria group bacterium]|nr:type II secretion system GspH family protein [Patescibacteria group bacterium]
MTTLRPRGFTLVELLAVVIIIGILSTIVYTSLTSARAKSRDAARLAALNEIKLALQAYASDHDGRYPISGWSSICTDGGSKTTSGSNGWIPDLAPGYIRVLPTDPLKGNAPCSVTMGNAYNYTSNADGTEYFVMAYGTVETYSSAATNPAPRPLADGLSSTCGDNNAYEKDFAFYSNGAQCW